MASVPLNVPGAAAEELRRAHEDLGLVGVEIGTSVGSWMLDAPELDPFFEAAAELRTPVMLHPHKSMLGDGLPPGLDRFFLSNLLGNSLETATAATRLILGGVLDRHPGLLIQLVHGGGYFPYQLGRLQRGYELRETVREEAARGPREYMDNFLVDTVLYDPTAIGFLLDMFGPDRVVFGTDLPFDMADLTGLEIRDSLDPEVARKVFAGNADRAYGLGLDQSTLEATR
jgi:aminocarboxymuconate-semialdehyde decarboxylase